MNMQPEIPADQCHHRFFFTEEFVTIKVDKVYFKLPTFTLKKQSRVFQKWAEQSESVLVEGLDAVDLERFLAVVFPTEYRVYESTVFDEWASILKVAHKWGFELITKLALEKIKPLSSPVDKVVLGKTYNILEWATEGRVQLCRRAEPITMEEALRMGLEEVVNISTTRHHISEVPAGVQDSTIRSVLSGKKPAMNATPDTASRPTPRQDTNQRAPDTPTSGFNFGSSIPPFSFGSSVPPFSFGPPVPPPSFGSSIPAFSSGFGSDQDPNQPDKAISSALEFRRQLSLLKSRLNILNLALNERKDGDQSGPSGNSRTTEIEEVETQMDELEEKYVDLYRGSIRLLSVGNSPLTVERTTDVRGSIEARLRMHLHPDATSRTLKIVFSQSLNQRRKGPNMEQNAVEVLNRYNLEYSTDETGITVQLP
ncbi:hypothetical protein BDN72DRAFT_849995 [Pluteus cervinus]|uniref:Uncharacterized protein n=1 Tax=Pluteus cervinus TaxID=181527 RepID=A0ACD3A5V4_9AGAR|nr:hypothetical protein BDN72DRAFT_849995 [Pluteus cervinus]